MMDSSPRKTCTHIYICTHTHAHTHAKCVDSIPGGIARIQGLQVTSTQFRASVLAEGIYALPLLGLLGKLVTDVLRGSVSTYWTCESGQNSLKGTLPHFKACTWKQHGWGFLSDSEPTGGSQVIFPGCAPNLALSLFIFFPLIHSCC